MTSCEPVERDLLAFHLGVVSEAERTAVEQHLEGCTACLRAYLGLKRSLETAELAPGPPPALQARVREAVAAELGLRVGWRWWERPLVLGFAGAALALALVTAHLVETSPGQPPRDPDLVRRAR